jgi:hypothetical protein
MACERASAILVIGVVVSPFPVKSSKYFLNHSSLAALAWGRCATAAAGIRGEGGGKSSSAVAAGLTRTNLLSSTP